MFPPRSFVLPGQVRIHDLPVTPGLIGSPSWEILVTLGMTSYSLVKSWIPACKGMARPSE
jgi:hypothetical protein